jgi:hypothetical protein
MSQAGEYNPDEGEDFEIEPDPPAAAIVEPPAPVDYTQLSDAECERLAHVQGWRPLNEYHGVPGKWKTARDYLIDGEQSWPLMRQANRRMTERLASMDSEFSQLRKMLEATNNTVAEQREIMQELRSYARNANEEGYKRARAEIEQRQDDAAAAGDQAGVRAAREQLSALDEARPAPAAEPRREPAREPARTQAPPPPPPREPPELTEIRRREPWIGVDPILTPIVVGEDNKLAAEFPEMPLMERFELAVANVKRANPRYFPSGGEPQPRARQPAAPAASSTQRGPVTERRAAAANTIASIADPTERADARKAFERNKRHFGGDYTEAEFMEIYNNPHTDVIEVQRRKAATRG